MIDYIFEFIVTHGVQMDDTSWEFNGTTVWLDGEDIEIEWGPRLNIVGKEDGSIDYFSGDFEDLETLYIGINSLEYSS